MSRIYEGLKIAQESRLRRSQAGGDSLGTMELPERRGSPRQALDIDLTVYGRSADDTPFYERAKAISGNNQGGLFQLRIPVRAGQELLLISNRTGQEQLCRVVHFRMRDEQTGEVAVAFPAPNPEFWDVSARNRKK
jgi:hypothetical protein